MQNLLHNLNAEQYAAVTLPAQHALILAGAGSGKTRVLTTRIAWLIQTQQVSPAGILAVTFTNKAAKEMLTRLSAMLPINTRGMWIGTFHGLCNRLLRTHYRDAALPQTFQILDSQDQLSVIKRLLKANNIDDEKFPPKTVMYFINNAKDQGLRATDVEAYDAHERKMVELYQLYDDQCQREGVVDFAELLLRTYELLSRNQPLREHYQARFRHILVDEFQDTNNLQYNWLKLLAGHGSRAGGALFAVGDDDQSIYAFRGANVGNMSAFEHEFQVQNLIKLEQNYRSHGHILDSANVLIANNSKRLGKNLRTDAGHGEQVRVYEASSDLQEAQWIIEEAKSLIADGASRSEIAILYRSNAQSRVIEHALFSAGMPYHVYGGQRYFQRAEVKHAIAYLQLMDNPHNDSAFLRVVNSPRGASACARSSNCRPRRSSTASRCTRPCLTWRARRAACWPASSSWSRACALKRSNCPCRKWCAWCWKRVPCCSIIRMKRKAPTASRTWSRWSARPASSFPRKVLARAHPRTWALPPRRSRGAPRRQPGWHRNPRCGRAAAGRDVAAFRVFIARVAGGGR